VGPCLPAVPPKKDYLHLTFNGHGRDCQAANKMGPAPYKAACPLATTLAATPGRNTLNCVTETDTLRHLIQVPEG
jgi:hypothetical protein